MTRRWAFAVITVLALTVFAPPLLRNEVFSFRDHTDYFQPLRWFTAVELQHGRLPLWNAYSASGEPWLANPQTGVFYPPAWLFVVLPFTTAYTLFLLLHVVLLGCGAFLLFARLTRPGGAALAAAVALMFSGPAMSLLDVSNNLTTFAWLPLILWCALSGVPARASSAAIAMSFLAGEPFFAAGGALLFAIVRRRDVRDLIDVALSSIALASVQLLPFLSMVADSDRAHGGVARAEILQGSMPLKDWLRIVIPPHLATAVDPRLGQHFIPIIYVGMLTGLFALTGIVTARRRAAGWIALIAACMLIGAGSHLPPVGDLLARLPVTIFRYPARIVPLAALGICALAAMGLDRVIRGAAWQLAIVMLMFVDALLQVQPLLVTETFNPHRVPYPAAVGRDAKIVRAGMPRNFDRDAWILGYLNLYDRRFDAWTAAPTVSQRYAHEYQSAMTHPDMTALDALSAGYVLAPRVLSSFDRITSARGVFVHRNRRALPLAYFLDDTTRRIRYASTLAFTSLSVYLDVNAPSGGDVVITQQASPGWSVTVDGKAANPHGSSTFRSVHVSRGRHAVKWSYRPLSLIIGAIVTLAAMVRLLFSAMIVKRSEREKNLRVSLKNA